MDKKITIDYSFTFPFINEEKINSYKNDVLKAMDTLENSSGAGNDFLGWKNLPSEMLASKELQQIIQVANEINENADLFICVGIGGSYLGAKAVTEALLHPFYNSLPKNDRNGPKIIFAGQNISGAWLSAVLDEMDKVDSVYVNVISKSGTTTEPGVAFRNIKQKMEKKYGKIESSKRIIATTDAKRGALKTLATNEGYRTFVIADDVGGRFSVLSPVGLLPIAAVGLDITKLLKGAQEASIYGKEKDLVKNPAATYAMVRNILLKEGYHTEILVNYEPVLHYISEWWKQLYGESEGKDGKGIFVASVDFTSDLHSMGQWIQDGQRFIFETVLDIEESNSNLKVVSDKEDLDGLEFLAGKTYSDINKKASQGTLLAHYEGKVPNIIFSIPELNEYYIGQLLYIFEQGCGISGYLLGVNPFDQPGVEAYKKNMFALLNKPGSEKAKQAIEEKMKNLPSGKKTI
ncbi:MAG: glucose-6-phosphate isomerase [Spirochaetes bacterium GWD1_27_9]|nr:MAG: glucose-6-phosphate isomerase [Spirochaetes bacterium GWB1_27_13]OHD23043.1 MAG: glucose-6-phosphate isomerase [Spirochaetes bacterium GWC1_27_15]OHD41365.1 MAG: glucose-6-phosphate isomerase [Spirochaetes bacterium GWD1_27_9]